MNNFAWAAIAAAVGISFAPPARAQSTSVWQGGTGDWFAAGNWSAGVPTASAAAQVENGGTAQVAAGSAAASSIGLGDGVGQQGSLAVSGGSLTASTGIVGNSGTGTLTVSGGNVSIPSLSLAYARTATGTINVQGGTLGGGTLAIGGNGGTGTVNQTDGTVSDVLGVGSSRGVGHYNLQGGAVIAPGAFMSVANAASTFNQTGGTLSVFRFSQSNGTVTLLPLGVGTNQSAAQYFLSGGTLSTPSVELQNGAIVTVSGGQLSANALSVGDGATLTISGGQLSVGTINFNGGTATLPAGVLDSGTPTLTFPTPTGVPQPKVTGTGTAVTVSAAYLGYAAGTTSYALPAAGLPWAASNLSVGYAAGSNATFDQGSAAPVAPNETVGYAGVGTLKQSGNVASISNLSLGTLAGSSGTYVLSGGTLNVSGSETVGGSGAGTFTQTDGTHAPSSLTLGAAGTYNLRGGTLTAGSITYNAGSQFTRSGGTLAFGQFVQLGGTVNADTAGGPFASPLTLGTATGQLNYLFSAGTLLSNTITVNPGGTFGAAAGAALACSTFNLAGGTASFPSVTLDSGSPAVSLTVPAGRAAPAFNLTSGTLAGDNVYLGATAGTFAYTQNGPVALGGSSLRVGYAAGSDATFMLVDGQTLSVSVDDIGGGGKGTFLQTGGSNAGLVLVSNGTYAQSGGTNALGGGNAIEVGATAGSALTAVYNLAGGSISTVGTEAVGYLAAGTFNQGGGSNVGQFLQVGSSPTAVGTYRLTGGTFSFYQIGVYDGTLSVANDSAVAKTSLTNASRVALAGADGASTAGQFADAGTYTQTSAGELDIGLGGPDASTGYAVLNAQGKATLDGTLVVTLTDGFVPAPGETFEILSAASVVGTFAKVVLPSGGGYTIDYEQTGVFVVAVPEPAAVGAAAAVLGGACALRRRARSA